MEPQQEKIFDLKSKIIENRTDIELQRLVKGINYHERGRVSVTLVVSGAIISGTAIGIKEYYELIGDIYTRGINDPKEAEEEREYYKKIGKKHFEEVRQSMDDDDVSDEDWFLSLPRYIHLKDVLLPVGIGLSSAPIVLRLKIESVDGYSLGSINTSVEALVK